MSKAQDTDIDDGLTDEERAALAEDEGVGEEAAEEESAESTEGKAAEEAPKDEAKEQEAAAADDKPADEQPAGAAEQPGADAVDTPAPGQQSAPLLVAQAPEDAEEKLTAIATKKDELIEKFDNGDITAREYQKELDALNKEERTIELDVREAQLAAKLEKQRQQNEWFATCNAFVASNSVYKDARLYRALDAEVRELASKPETANWSGQKILEEAHKNLSDAFGLPSAKAAAPAPKTPVKPRAELPPNLAKVPSAEIEDTSGGKFAVLDRMANTDPIGYEAALAKMSEADRNAYLASA